jgi:putative hydrolase of the HAD superfamily
MTVPLVLSFDLDDTLWPVAPVMRAAETAMLEWLEERHPEIMRGRGAESLRELRVRVATRYPERSHDMTFLRRRALAELFMGEGQDPSHADEAFEVFFAVRNRVTLYAEVEATLARLAQRHRLFALSNGNADLQRCGIAHLFDGHVTAIAAGAAKPDERIFSHLLHEAGRLHGTELEAAQVMHVGDDPQADVMGATRAGMQAVWLNRDSREWPVQWGASPRTISTLAELL